MGNYVQGLERIGKGHERERERRIHRGREREREGYRHIHWPHLGRQLYLACVGLKHDFVLSKSQQPLHVLISHSNSQCRRPRTLA
jgi:hypothetical protein